jgi:hypothetical protein
MLNTQMKENYKQLIQTKGHLPAGMFNQGFPFIRKLFSIFLFLVSLFVGIVFFATLTDVNMTSEKKTSILIGGLIIGIPVFLLAIWLWPNPTPQGQSCPDAVQTSVSKKQSFVAENSQNTQTEKKIAFTKVQDFHLSKIC